MAGEWVETSFPDVIDFQEGPGILAKDFRDEGIPLVRLAGLDRGSSVLTGCNYLDPAAVAKKWAHFVLAEGDILLSTSAALGRIAVVGDDAVGAIPYTGIIRMRPRDARLFAPFIRYLLEGPNFQQQAEMVGAGSVIRHFGPMHLRQMSVQLPPTEEQRAIAHILGTLDDKIELNRRMSATLEAMGRALFKAWFVDFEPVRAKTEGRDPGLPPNLAVLFPDRLVETEHGEVPEGWEVKSLSDCVEVVRGLSYKGSGLSEIGVPMHNLNSIYESGGYKHDGLKRYNGDYRAQHVACAGDVIVANTEQGHHRLLIGYAAIVPACFERESLFSHHIYRVRPKRESRVTSDYLCHLLNTSVMHDVVSGYANGTTVNMLPIDALQSPLVVIPPAGAISAFTMIAETARLRHEEMVEESRTLVALRDTLLPKLISGDLRVKDAETFLDRVL